MLRQLFSGDLAKAIRTKTDLHFGTYHSLYEWFNPLYLEDKNNNFNTQTYVKVRPCLYLFKLLPSFWFSEDALWHGKTHETKHQVKSLDVCFMGVMLVFQTKLLPEIEDLVNTYKPEIFWSDGQWEAPCSYWNCTDVIAWLYNERYLDIHRKTSQCGISMRSNSSVERHQLAVLVLHGGCHPAQMLLNFSLLATNHLFNVNKQSVVRSGK